MMPVVRVDITLYSLIHLILKAFSNQSVLKARRFYWQNILLSFESSKGKVKMVKNIETDTPLFSLFLNSRKDIMRIQVPRAFRIYLHYMTAYLMFDFTSRLFLMSEIHWRSFLCLLLLITNFHRSHEFVIITFSVLKFVILDF